MYILIHMLSDATINLVQASTDFVALKDTAYQIADKNVLEDYAKIQIWDNGGDVIWEYLP